MSPMRNSLSTATQPRRWKELIDSKADVANARLLLSPASNIDVRINDHDDTPLIYASKEGRSEVVQLLLDNKAGVNIANKNGYTALYWASRKGYTEIFQLLLDNRPDINVADEDGYTALSWASHKGHTEIAQLLLDNKADVNAAGDDGSTALYCASNEGHTEIVQPLLDNKADVNVADKDGYTALCCASNEGHAEIVQLLLDNKADVNVADKNGYTALYCASHEGHTEIVQLLLDNKADVNIASQYGTALHGASSKGHTEIVPLLLDSKADVNIADKYGETALDVAKGRQLDKIVKLFTKYKNKVDNNDQAVSQPQLNLSLEHKQQDDAQHNDADMASSSSSSSSFLHRIITSVPAPTFDSIDEEDLFSFSPGVWLSKKNKLGEGICGQVFVGFHQILHKREPIAVKYLNRGVDETLINEVDAMQKLSSSCRDSFVQLFDVKIVTEGFTKSAYIMLELCAHDLNHQEWKNQLATLPLHDRRIYTKQLLFQLFTAIAHMHCKNVVHRDLKPANLLIAYNGKLKLSDFGISRAWEAKKASMMTMVTGQGSLECLAPEIIIGEKQLVSPSALTRADMYSAGCIAYYIASGGKHVFHMMDREKSSFDLKQNRENIKNVGGLFLVDLIQRLIKFNPNDRLTAQECLNHPYFWRPERFNHIFITFRDYLGKLEAAGITEGKKFEHWTNEEHKSKAMFWNNYLKPLEELAVSSVFKEYVHKLLKTKTIPDPPLSTWTQKRIARAYGKTIRWVETFDRKDSHSDGSDQKQTITVHKQCPVWGLLIWLRNTVFGHVGQMVPSHFNSFEETIEWRQSNGFDWVPFFVYRFILDNMSDTELFSLLSNG